MSIFPRSDISTCVNLKMPCVSRQNFQYDQFALMDFLLMITAIQTDLTLFSHSLITEILIEHPDRQAYQGTIGQ